MLYGRVSHTEQVPGVGDQSDTRVNLTMSSLSDYFMSKFHELSFAGVTELGSARLTEEIPRFGILKKRIAGHLDDSVSAIGIEFAPLTRIVTSVDPACDCYGFVLPGDKLLSIDGENPEAYIFARKNVSVR